MGDLKEKQFDNVRTPSNGKLILGSILYNLICYFKKKTTAKFHETIKQRRYTVIILKNASFPYTA